MMNSLQPYQFELEREVSNKNENEEECVVNKYLHNDNGTRVRNCWCPCSKCKIKGRKIDCLCCKEVSGFVGEIRRGEHYMHYRKKPTNSAPFFKLHFVLKYLSFGFHDLRGDILEKKYNKS